MDHLQLIGFPLFIVGGLEVLLAMVLLRENPRNSPVNKSIATFSFFTGAFSLITAVMYVRASFGFDITGLARANWIGWLIIPATAQFVFYLKDEKSRIARIAGWVLYPFWTIIFFISVTTNLIESGNYTLLPYIDRSGPLGKPLRMVGIIVIFWVVYEIFRLRRHVTGIKRAQLNYFIHGVLIFAGGAGIFAGVLQLFGGFGFEPGLSSYFSLPWVVLTFYSITRYRLFDIRSIFSRVITISILALFFSLIQTGFFSIAQPVLGTTFTIIVSLFFIGFLFFATSFVNTVELFIRRIVLQEKFDYQQILKESIKAIITILDLKELLNYLVYSIRTSIRSEKVCLFLKADDGQYRRRPETGLSRPLIAPLCDDEVLDGSAVEWIKRSGGVTIREELEGTVPEEEFRFLNTYMKQNGIELFIPMYYKGGLQGVLGLGQKGDGEPYAQSDIDLLETLAGHAAVALENARLYAESRLVQESSRQNQERFRNLIETTSDWVWEMNDRGVYTYVNPKIRDILGHEPQDVLGKTFFDFMPKEEARRVADFFVSMAVQKKPFLMFKNSKVHKEGRLVILESSGVPVFDGKGAFTGYRGIDRDVTERYDLEGKLRYVQKMEAIGRLAGGIAHDLNAIVHSVTGHAELLHLNMKKEDPLRSSIEHILAAADRASKITRNLLALGDKKALDLKIVKVNDIIRGVEKLLTGLLRENIKLSLYFEDEDWPIRADSTQLERVLMNIISNAVDAMPDDGQLTIESGLAEINDEFTTEHGYGKPGPYAVISVSDTGKGMDDHTRRRIFEPFFTTKSYGKGTGFGLSIVYDIVKEHQGYITVDTVPGKGSRFSIYLPLQLSPFMDTIPASSDSPIQNRPAVSPDGDGESSGAPMDETR